MEIKIEFDRDYDFRFADFDLGRKYNLSLIHI